MNRWKILRIICSDLFIRYAYLLDTHTLIWFLHNDKQLSDKALEVIKTSNVVVSIATLWEIAIKMSLGKLELAQPFEDFFPKQLQLNDIEVLAISIKHLIKLKRLQQYHRDPFDRIIIAQTITEGMTLISRDSAFKDYNFDLLW